MFKMKQSFLLLFCILSVFFLIASCKQARKVTDIITQPSPRELYARQFEKDSILFPAWESSFQQAFRDSLRIELPYEESGTFFQGNVVSYSYDMELHHGEIFHAEVKTDSVRPAMFMDLYRQKANAPSPGDSINSIPFVYSMDSYDFIVQNGYLQKTISKNIEVSGSYKLVVQPGFESKTDFQLALYSTPSYAFPVAGKNNEAIQSFWGADRDGGKRSHQGVDIFADRGTPVTAATEGRISSTGERGLGGKQVWLRSGLLGNSLYYAHLDSIAVNMGQKVRIGDTLGFVGNTGNARTTSPHLHFGIYKGYRGAIDPLPFIRINDMPESKNDNISLVSSKITVSAPVANLRNLASTQGRPAGKVKKGDTLSVLGITGNWAHIKTTAGQTAYVHQSLLRFPKASGTTAP